MNFHSVFAQMDMQSLNGIWEMNGYGKIIEISDSEVSIYDLTKISCVFNYKVKRSEIKQLGKFKLLNSDSLNLKLGITDYYLHRIQELPDQKLISDSLQLKSPKLNLDVFWHTLNDNYAFFEQRKMNWQEVYETLENEDIRNDKDLFKIFSKITEQLGDEHTTVRASEDIMEDYQETSDTINNNIAAIENISIADLEERIFSTKHTDRHELISKYGNDYLRAGFKFNLPI